MKWDPLVRVDGVNWTLVHPPELCVVHGWPYVADPLDLRDWQPTTVLIEDMFQFVLANGVTIDVGWYPDSSLAGEYHVCTIVSASTKSPPYARFKRRTRDPETVRAIVKHLAEKLRWLVLDDDRSVFRNGWAYFTRRLDEEHLATLTYNADDTVTLRVQQKGEIATVLHCKGKERDAIIAAIRAEEPNAIWQIALRLI